VLTHAGDALTPSTRRRLTIVLGALTALGPFTIDLYLPAFPAVALSLATNAAAIQATLAGTTIGIAVGQVIMGPWSDRVGRRMPLLLATAAHVLASLACAVAPDVISLTIARFVMGAAAAAGGVVAAAMVRDLYSGVPMMRLSSRLAMINGAAPIIAPVIGSVLLTWVDWRGIFVVLAAYAAVVVVATAAFIPESHPPVARSRGGFREIGGVARRQFRDRVFVVLMVTGGMVWGTEFTYLAGSSFLLQSTYGLSPTQYGLVFAVNALGYVAGTQLGVRVVHRISPHHLLAISTMIMVIAAIAFFVFESLDLRAGVLASMWVSVAAVGVSVPCATALALNRVNRNVGTAAAILGAVNFGIAGLVTPLASFGSGMGPIMIACSTVAAGLSIALTRMAVGWPAVAPTEDFS
jgi:DHA1 family bicyclomycin/chloramphenicol resistance-like MFS transporter